MSTQAFREKINYIKSRWDCITYASQVLGWPVQRDGDRYLSMEPDSTNHTALIIHEQTWYDFKTSNGGDVIDLCAFAKYNGDKGLAIRELSEGFKGEGEFDELKWKAKTQEQCNKIQFFHENLRPVDREYLHSRGINDETIERLKLGFDENTYTLTIPYFKNGAVVYWAGRDRWDSAQPPHYLEGKGDGSTPVVHDFNLVTCEIEKYEHVNPDWIIWNEKAKGRPKYHKAALNGYNENIPWGLHTLTPEFKKSMNAPLCEEFPDAEDTLCMLEGAFDVMSFEQRGFMCLSPIGGYFNKNVNQFVIDLIKSRGFKKVFVCFDSDAPGQGFNMRMAQLLFQHRIPFVIGQLPKEINNHPIKDVSDYYTLGGDLIDLVKNAEDGITALAKAITNKSEFKEFIYQCARYVDRPDMIQMFQYVKERGTFDRVWLSAIQKECLKAPSEKIIVDEIIKKYMIKFIDAVGFYIYDKAGFWKLHTDNEIRNIIADHLGLFANGGRLNTVLTYLKAACVTRDDFDKNPVINFVNGVLNLETGELMKHSPAFMSSHQLKFKYDPDAKCPKWDKFSSEIMSHDPDKIKLLHESFGYILVPDLRFQKCFIFYGEGANGKSVALNVIIKLFGEEVCTSVPLSLLASMFEPIRLRPSTSWVNIMTETDTNLKEAEARFKLLVVGDRISAAYKGKDSIEFTPRSVPIMASNTFFKTSDVTKGFVRRLMIIAFKETFEGPRANKNLTNELCEELPGIFNRIYEAYKRLMQNQEFTQTSEQQELLAEFLKTSEPVESFADEDLTELTGTWPSTYIYSRYVEWCKGAGHNPKSRNKFTRTLKMILERRFPNVKIIRTRKGYEYTFNSESNSDSDSVSEQTHKITSDEYITQSQREIQPTPLYPDPDYDLDLRGDYFRDNDNDMRFDNPDDSYQNINGEQEIPF